MSATRVYLPPQVYQKIVVWAEKVYPHEGCGLLIGQFSSQNKKVLDFWELQNDLLARPGEKAPTLPQSRQGVGTGKTEFLMNPDEFNKATLKAEKEGLDIVGIVHTHPDHPPRPSQIDASQPFLSAWSNIIVSVQNGKTADIKSWFRDDDQQPFTEEEMIIQQSNNKKEANGHV